MMLAMRSLNAWIRKQGHSDCDDDQI